ncbi:MAG TPA: hypothetical protein VLV83_26200 [Acidobacteriota bacterium]|nr:hypothetical protein [Acidobacteriota bacterium]
MAEKHRPELEALRQALKKRRERLTDIEALSWEFNEASHQVENLAEKIEGVKWKISEAMSLEIPEAERQKTIGALEDRLRCLEEEGRIWVEHGGLIEAVSLREGFPLLRGADLPPPPMRIHYYRFVDGQVIAEPWPEGSAEYQSRTYAKPWSNAALAALAKEPPERIERILATLQATRKDISNDPLSEQRGKWLAVLDSKIEDLHKIRSGEQPAEREEDSPDEGPSLAHRPSAGEIAGAMGSDPTVPEEGVGMKSSTQGDRGSNPPDSQAENEEADAEDDRSIPSSEFDPRPYGGKETCFVVSYSKAGLKGIRRLAMAMTHQAHVDYSKSSRIKYDSPIAWYDNDRMGFYKRLDRLRAEARKRGWWDSIPIDYQKRYMKS